MAKAIAFAIAQRLAPRGRASKARPAPAPPKAGASRPPGQAPASVIVCRAVSGWPRPEEVARLLLGCVFTRTHPRHPWRRPSPSPLCKIGQPSGRGPQRPPASARPAHGGRFSPAGAGAGLWYLVPNRLWLNRHARAGARRCLALSRPANVGCVFTRTIPCMPWRRPSPSPLPDIAALTGRASKARPAPAPPSAGASRPPGRAPASDS